MNPFASSSTRTLGALGVIGPLAFTLAWVTSGIAQHAYDPQREFISALASETAQLPWLMIGGFLVCGFTLVGLSSALLRTCPERRWGAWVIGFAGVCIAADGLLRQDCSTTLTACAAADPSWHAVAHEFLAVAVFVSLVAAPLLLRMDRAVAVVGLILLVVVGAEPAPEIAGLVQRAFVTLMFGWIALVGLRIASGHRMRSASGEAVVA